MKKEHKNLRRVGSGLKYLPLTDPFFIKYYNLNVVNLRQKDCICRGEHCSSETRGIR
ncbi:MAG: hypothetical protein FWF46_02200 [Oscillospiraceae bacterium]|nr:hypothetical protein [Oscillospiraceae bacterium]